MIALAATISRSSSALNLKPSSRSAAVNRPPLPGVFATNRSASCVVSGYPCSTAAILPRNRYSTWCLARVSRSYSSSVLLIGSVNEPSRHVVVAPLAVLRRGFERAEKCNVRELFASLRAVVRDDVRSAGEHIQGEVTLDDGPQHTVFRVVLRQTAGGNVLDARCFALVGSEIQVLNKDSRPLLSARASLINGVDCLLEVDEHREPMHLWRSSRLALEDVFFANR